MKNRVDFLHKEKVIKILNELDIEGYIELCKSKGIQPPETNRIAEIELHHQRCTHKMVNAKEKLKSMIWIEKNKDEIFEFYN